ncbi:MAG: hypothetical protein ISS41_02135 [Candidatus Aminicenantes bacterium]|nr:hypothetical protein [Candidatus Aminicenantes bacterium]MBL7082414.1 hypothetical protein [Candidatus Aminicenantes bacterium]
MRIKGLSLKNFAIVISDYLRKNGIEVILTGGACVVIYTDNKYMSYDLDFVLISYDRQKEVKQLLIDIGFYEEGRYYKHSDSEYFIDFVSPPLSVGEEPVKEISEIKKGKLKLKLLSPTDCVKDRLAAFYYWNDRQALEQAVLVCKDNKVDLSEVERWSENEEKSSEFERFKKILTETVK